PEAQMGDREGLVVAHILTAGLLGVTGEVRLLISPHILCCRPQHQDAENEEHSEPHLPDDRGMLLGILQQPAQEAPVAHASRREQ
ncbi:hypothetical protein NQD34_015849, partial [Periophthalmus magnuspinnatus]